MALDFVKMLSGFQQPDSNQQKPTPGSFKQTTGSNLDFVKMLGVLQQPTVQEEVQTKQNNGTISKIKDFINNKIAPNLQTQGKGLLGQHIDFKNEVPPKPEEKKMVFNVGEGLDLKSAINAKNTINKEVALSSQEPKPVEMKLPLRDKVVEFRMPESGAQRLLQQNVAGLVEWPERVVKTVSQLFGGQNLTKENGKHQVITAVDEFKKNITEDPYFSEHPFQAYSLAAFSGALDLLPVAQISDSWVKNTLSSLPASSREVEMAKLKMGFAPNETVTNDSLNKSFRNAARVAHPDVGGSNKAFQELNNNYEVLKNSLDENGIIKPLSDTTVGQKIAQKLNTKISDLFSAPKTAKTSASKVFPAQQIDNKFNEIIPKTNNLIPQKPTNHLLVAPKTLALPEVAAKESPVVGNGFTMLEKANKQNLITAKVYAAYQDALKSYNANPTPTKLKKVLAAREALPGKTVEVGQNGIVTPQTETPSVPAPQAPAQVSAPAPTQISAPKAALFTPTRSEVPVTTPSEKPDMNVVPAMPNEKPTLNFLTPKETSGASVEPLKPVGEGALKQSKLAERIRAKAVADGLIKDIESDPSSFAYNTAENKVSLQRAGEMLANNPEKLIKIAKGEVQDPDILSGAALEVARRWAKETQNYELVRDLSNARNVSLLSTRHGQEIQILSNIDPTDPSAILQKVREAREEKASRKIKTDVESVRKEVRKSVSKKQTWEEFINSIECV